VRVDWAFSELFDSTLPAETLFTCAKRPQHSTKEKLKLLKKCAELKFVKAMMALGNHYLKEEKTFEAIDWYNKVIDNDPHHAKACYKLGTIYWSQNNEVDKNYSKEWFTKALEYGCPQITLEGIGTFTTVEEIAALAESEAPPPSFNEIFNSSLPVLFKWVENFKFMRTLDKTEYFKLILKAAEANHPYSIKRLGYMYSVGYGTDKDPVQALHWSLLAANAGETTDSVLCERIGNIYWIGQGIPQDKNSAKEWFLKVLQAGKKVSVKDENEKVQTVLITIKDLENLI